MTALGSTCRTAGGGCAFARRIRLASGLLALVAGALATPLPAQHARFAHLGSGDGLADDGLLDITQDRTGFMWFATINGLNRYDGRNMRVYRFQLDNPHSLPGNRVEVVHVDRAGTLWVGTTGGLSRYEPASDAFTNFLVEDHLQLPNRMAVGSIVDDATGILWLGTSRGVYLFDPRTRRATSLAVPWPGGPSATRPAVLLQDDRGHIWIGSQDRGLADFDPRSGRFRFYANTPGQASSFPANDIRDATQAGDGTLWVATYGAGLVHLDPRTGEFRNFRHDPARSTTLAWDNLYRLRLDPRGGLWIGTQGKGVVYRDPAGRFYQYLTGEPGGISGTHFSALFVDRTGTLWAGSHSMGVSRLLRSSTAIRTYLPASGPAAGLANPSVLGFAEAKDGTIWVANSLGGLGEFDPGTDRYTRHSNAEGTLNVLAVAVHPDGGIWLGTWRDGLARYDPRTGAFRFYNPRNSGVPADVVFALHVDGAGLVWAGTGDQGLFSLDPATGRVRRYRIAPDGYPQWQIWLIRELSDRRLALGTLANGLVLIEPRTGRRTSYLSSAATSALSSHDVRALLEAEPGTLWLGTDAGLDRLDLRSGAVAHFTEADGLPSDVVTGLALDARRNLWISSGNGVVRFDPRTRATLAFTPADGLQGREYNPRAYLQARDGTLYFGGNNGFNAIRPSLLAADPYRPPVVITGLRLFNQPIVPGRRDSPLRRSIEVTRQLALKHDQSVITLEFAALDFNAPERNQYAYRLEGFDERWTDAGTGGTATFTGLPPGHYVFRVRGSNGDGIWNEQGASLRITIVPAFWQTWWFRLLLALLLVAAVVLAIRTVRARQRRLAEMNRQLEEAAERDRERQRRLQGQVLDILSGMRRFGTGETAALPVEGGDAIGELRDGINRILADRRRAEAEMRQAQKMDIVGRLAGVVANDFNNVLTVMQGFTGGVLTKLAPDQQGRKELEEVKRATERAGSLTRQLLAFSRAQVVRPRPLSVNAVVRDLSRRLRLSAGKAIDLRLELDDAAGWLYADSAQLEQVLLNLVVNARDAMPDGGVLTIATRRVERAELRGQPGRSGGPYVALSVSDTGTGIPHDAREHIFEPFFTTKKAEHAAGLGLTTVYGSMKKVGGFVQVDSAPGRGTTFTLYFPRLAYDDEAAEAEEAVSAPAQARRSTILLVEDEAAIRDLTARVLHAAGYRVLVAEGGEAALRVAERDGPIDMLLADVAVAGVTGSGLAARIMRQHPGSALLYTCSATPTALVGVRPLAGRTAFLEKPFAPAELLRQVAALLRSEPGSGT